MLLRENDDPVVSPRHNLNFAANRITTRSVDLAAGEPHDGFVTGRCRPRAARSTARRSRRSPSAHARLAAPSWTPPGGAAGAPTAPSARSRSTRWAARCAAWRAETRPVPSRSGPWKKTSFRVQGEISAARIWARLRTTISGRRALAATAARRVKLSVRTADRSRVIPAEAQKPWLFLSKR